MKLSVLRTQGTQQSGLPSTALPSDLVTNSWELKFYCPFPVSWRSISFIVWSLEKVKVQGMLATKMYIDSESQTGFPSFALLLVKADFRHQNLTVSGKCHLLPDHSAVYTEATLRSDEGKV
jgi:hypothetical protein